MKNILLSTAAALALSACSTETTVCNYDNYSAGKYEKSNTCRPATYTLNTDQDHFDGDTRTVTPSKPGKPDKPSKPGKPDKPGKDNASEHNGKGGNDGKGGKDRDGSKNNDKGKS